VPPCAVACVTHHPCLEIGQGTPQCARDILGVDDVQRGRSGHAEAVAYVQSEAVLELVSGERTELARAGGVLNRMDERLPSRELA
jgi:hypothetical protein